MGAFQSFGKPVVSVSKIKNIGILLAELNTQI
jgi:hypothetical protein